MFSLTSLLALTLSLDLCQAVITPTSPDGSTVVRQGQTLTALWTADTTGTWNNTEIQLMTGDNFQMVPLRTLATGIDGTTTTTFSTPCPAVSPNAKIYFLQFTQGGDVTTATWTTRFTIAAEDGTTSQPTNTTNYSGTDVQWGTGALLDGESTNSTTGSSSSASASGASSVSGPIAASSTSSGLTLYNPSASASASSASGGAIAAASASVSSVSARASSASSASAAPAASSSRSAAGAVGVSVGTGAGVGLLGVVMSLLL